MEKGSLDDRGDSGVLITFAMVVEATAPTVPTTGSTRAWQTDTPNFVGLESSDTLASGCCDFMCISGFVKFGDPMLVRLERNFRSASKKYVAEKMRYVVIN